MAKRDKDGPHVDKTKLDHKKVMAERDKWVAKQQEKKKQEKDGK
jgi:hypothetical protein